MKRFKRLFCIIFSAVFLMISFLQLDISVLTDELTSDVIKEKEAELSEVKKEKKQLQAGLTDVKSIKQKLESEKSDLANYITKLDAELTAIQQRIDELNNQITAKEEEITQKEKELDEALAVQTAQYEAMKKRIKFMYERGDAMYLELVFSSKNFSDILNKAEYIESLSAYDRRMLNEYVQYTEYVTLCKEILEEEKAVLDETKLAQEEEEKSLNELIDAKKEEIARVNADIMSKEDAIADIEAEIEAQNDMIATLEKVIAEERKRLAAQNGRKYDGGKFAFPCPSMVKVSSDFGYRIHPTLGTQLLHNGIDMAAPGGSPILAAYNGTVVAADYSSTMGNYVMIDHGDGVYTVYMHASALYVSKGQEVSRGQKIAAVGSTGRSTGNHLHFSVRVNGNYVSPWPYISS